MITILWIICGLYAFNLVASSLRSYFYFLIAEDIFDDMEPFDYTIWGLVVIGYIILGPLAIISTIIWLSYENIPIYWGVYTSPKED